MLLRSIVLALGAALAVGMAGPASAHGEAVHARAAANREQKPWGIAGDATAVRRTIRVTMSDAMRFEPAAIEVRQGETVRFVVANRGALRHEFVLGTRQELDQHAALMVKFPTMEHDEPYMAHVAPGKTAELIWTFNRAGDFEFACLIAGHFQAGMSGRIRVLAKTHHSPGERHAPGGK
jgi:uncharacterized cupredoxin-like copper-binding protein